MAKTQQPRKLKGSPAPATATGAWRQHGLFLLLLWAFLLIAYSNSFQSGFLFDNQPVLLEDPRIRDATAQNAGSILTGGYWYSNPASGLYRPLTTLSYLVNYAVLGDGASPSGYHWINFSLHGVNVSLAYGAGLVIFSEPWLAAALAAIWGLHPLLTESVTNIVGRADELAAFGVLAGLLCYARWISAVGKRKWWWLAALAAAQAIGLFSKENAAVLPGILLLYDFTFSGRAAWRSRIPAYAALALPFAAFLYLRSALHAYMQVVLRENPLIGADFWTARLTAVKVIGKYLWLFAWPARLSPDYSYNAFPLFGWNLARWEDDKAIVALIVSLTALALAFWWLRRSKPLCFFVLFFFLAILPTANLVLIIGSIMAERFLYLPAIGLAGALVSAANALGRRWHPRAAGIALGILSLAFATRTHARNFDWRDELSLWSNAVEVCPGAARAHLNLGDALARIPGRQNDAIAQYRTAFGIQPDYVDAHYNLATLFEGMPGHLNDSIAEFRAAIRIRPDFAGAHNNLGNALAHDPMRLNEAIVEWQAAVRINPDYGDAHYNLGNAYSEMPGRLTDAIAEYKAALVAEPGLAEAHNNLANALAREPNRMPEAMREWRAALRAKPGLVQAHVNLGAALAQVPGQLSNAIAELQAAERLHPDPQVEKMLDQLLNQR